MWSHSILLGVYSAEKKYFLIQFKQSISMTILCRFLCLTGSLTSFLAEIERLVFQWAWEWVQAVCWRTGGEAPHINTRRKRRVGAFLTASFLRHASFAFQSILPVKDCLQTWISSTERERVWITYSPPAVVLSAWQTQNSAVKTRFPFSLNSLLFYTDPHQWYCPEWTQQWKPALYHNLIANHAYYCTDVFGNMLFQWKIV